MKELQITAKEVKSNDRILFGSELYRVYLIDPISQNGRRKGHVEIWLISDRRHDTSDKIIIEVFLDPYHPVTAIRPSDY